MDEQAKGIVLRYHQYSETSLIIRWLTLEHGRIDTIARGANRPASPYRGKLDLFYCAEFTFARSRRSDLHSLRELRLLETFAGLRSDLARLQQASYASLLIAQTTEPGLAVPELFHLLSAFLQHLARSTPSAVLTIAFEWRFLTALGLQPNPADLRLSPSGWQIINHCQTLDWHQLANPPAAQTTEVADALQQFMEFNLGRVPLQRARLLADPGS